MAEKVTKKVDFDAASLRGENAYLIMGGFKKACSRQGWSIDEINKVLDEAMSGDYDNLCNTIESYCN